MIPVTITHVSLSNVGFVVLLKSQQDNRSLPIFIGVPEAQAIALPLNHVELPRPLTHDLLKIFLDVLECRVERVEICELRDNTFYATLVVAFESQFLNIDARPSDAIALALRTKSPIFVAENVMDNSGMIINLDEESRKRGEEKPLPPPGKAEELKQRLDQAIHEERYEDAARLRDELRLLRDSN